jgi:PAS domain S-box-containing protein
LEDSAHDVELMASGLERGGFRVQFDVADSADTFRKRLEEAKYDVILAEFNLRNWTAFDALEIMRRSGKGIPLVVVTGGLGDEAAAECLKQGAADYVLKDRPSRLPAAVQRVLEEKRLRTENQRAFGAVSRLATIVESSDDAIIGKTLEEVITSWNKGAEALYGYAAAEVVGRPISILVPLDRFEELPRILARLRGGERVEHYESVRVRKDGSLVDVSLSMFPLIGPGGEVIGAASIARDITERKRADKALRQSEAKLKEALLAAQMGIWEWTVETDTVTWDENLYRIAGRDSILFAPGSQEHPQMYAPGSWERLKAAGENALATGIPFELDMELVRPDGSKRWVIDRGEPLRDASGRIMGLRGTVQDITERKRAEEALKEERHLFCTLMDNLPDVIFFKDRESRFTRVNLALAKKVDLDRPADAVGKTDFDIFTAEQAYRDEQEIIRMGQPVVGKEEKETWPDGHVTWASTTKMPLRDANGNTIGTFGISRDITERKRAEEALRRSEASLAEGEKLTHTGSWTWNVSTGELFWSQETYRIFGFDPAKDKASVSDTFLARIHPEDRARIEAGLRNLRLQEASEYRIVLPDGSIRHIHNIAHGVTDAAGKIVERFGVACDITERRQAQQALRQSEERFRQIAETIDEVFWTADPQITKMFYVSPAYERIWGRSVASLYGDPRSFPGSIYPDDRERVLADHQFQKSGQSFDHEYRIVCPDGAVRWIWDRGFPVRNEAGQVVRYAGVAIDITERKRAEAEHVRLVTAIEQSAEAVMITNTSGEIEYVNPTFSRITGYSREEARGQNPRILKSGEQDPALYQQLWATILQGKIWHGELINRRKDGSLYNEQMNIAPVRGEHGEVTHFIATKQDITARKELEQRFVQAQKMEAVGRLAGGVAHDFNNLLTVINGYAQILTQRSSPKDPSRGLFEEIQMAGERAASLTRQLLAFSRRQVLEPKVLDLSNVLANTETMLRRLIGEDVELVTKLRPGLGLVKVDPGQIEQVIMNLAVNSRDAMPQGGKFIIETTNVEADEDYARTHKPMTPGKYVVVSVSDTGCGLDLATQAHIFEPFFTTKAKGKGTGLGLATVYGIVKQSGGFIWVYSEPGQGATFKIYFPCVEEVASTAKPSRVRRPAKLAKGKETILVVEDESGVRSLVCETLKSKGYNTLAAEGAAQALKIAEQYTKPIHLLLTDVVMPLTDGKELATRLSSLHPESKVLYMSGYTDDAVVRHGISDGGTPLLQKPFLPNALLLKVREVLRMKRGT